MAGMLALSELLADAVLRLLPRFSVKLLAFALHGRSEEVRPEPQLAVELRQVEALLLPQGIPLLRPHVHDESCFL